MYTLYYSPGACSMAIHVLLNELGVPFKAQKVQIHGEKSPELLKVNPRGAVPVLTDDGFPIREGAAIAIYLCDEHESPLLPRSGKERAAALEWLCFANATLHPAYGRGFGLLGKSDQEAALKIVTDRITTLWVDVDNQLAKTKYIAGNEVTVADILLTVIANWSPKFNIQLPTNVKKLIKDISSRPAYQKALKEEQVEYKAAA